VSAVLTTDLAVRINEAHALAVEHAGKAVTHAISTGTLLIEAKAAVPHGKWLPWLRENIQFSERTAQAYMRIAGKKNVIWKEIRNGSAELSVNEALKRIATTRKQAFFHDLAELLDNKPPARPANVADWTPADAKGCADSIRAFDQFMHRHGLCNGDCCCLVCSEEGRCCEPLCHACLDEAA
jgi:hypothetical protein